MAAYEGIKMFFVHLMECSRQEMDGNLERNGMAISDEVGESVKGIAALLLPISASQDNRFFPTPENSNTETVRVARARAVLAYASCGFQDVQDKA
jgi:hypothetical protein